MMRRALRWAAHLYPLAWRERYGDEFAALIEDSGGGWRVLLDVLKGAIAMQMGRGGGWKWVAAGGVAGALVAGIAAWKVPKQYISTAVLRAPDREHLAALEQTTLSRTSLTEVITENGLYRQARAEQPMEDVVQDMLMHDIHIRPVATPVTPPGVAFTVSYAATSPEQAQSVTRAIINHFQSAARNVTPLELLDPASFPEQPASPRPQQWIAAGLALGLGIGLLAAGTRRWPWVAASGLAGALITAALCLALPKQYVSTAVVQGDAVRTAPSLVTDAALQHLLDDTGLNLYPEERGKLTPSQLAARLRQDITIQPVRPNRNGKPLPHPVIQISFRYPDRFKAQTVTHDFVRRFQQAGAEVLDPPSLPQNPFRPAAMQWTAAGLLAGLLGGMAITWIRNRKLPALAQA